MGVLGLMASLVTELDEGAVAPSHAFPCGALHTLEG
jgi:hypothetical protein